MANHKKSNMKKMQRIPQLTENQVRKIAREEIQKWHAERVITLAP